VFSKSAYESYVVRVLQEIANARSLAPELNCDLPEHVDSIYMGGGTPSILDGTQLLRIFEVVRGEFKVTRDAEITVECAPGTLSSAMIDTLRQCGVNRVSLGMQSFVDEEAKSVGRIHTRAKVLDEIESLRAAGIGNINIDLLAGLPHQTAQSWAFSLAETVALQVPHVSVYMLEVDEDSRLGRELIAGGTRYHAHFVPDDGATTDFYQYACETMNQSGVEHYEISNFARAGKESRHNMKYWTRQPYLGFGVDAHSMLATSGAEAAAVRFSNPDTLDGYMNGVPRRVSAISSQAAIEESFFLGLRLNRGVDLDQFKAQFTRDSIAPFESAIRECEQDGLIEECGASIRLTARGRLISNEVFARFLQEEAKVGTGNVHPR
jgi:oxygen-independent coproporphyrinogen-3 oxidase